jgi:2,4-dienoyl-CoA reductase-like NADH-dependent reductase (Old Yellow Enzyme family)/ribulose 1,5-bisphosphate synthetase/thiazole synthase
MTDHFPMLFSPGRIGTLELPNRIVMAPMATSFASAEGEVTEWMLDYYAKRARGGAGLLIIENANVDYPSGKSGTTQLRVDQDRFIPGLFRLAQAIHAEGAHCALQINHAGAVAKKASEEGGQPVAPSEWPDGLYPTNPKTLAISEIQVIIARFAMAAQRAQKAGFDAVEIHGAHAYLIAQFLSPLTNHREDIYGGHCDGRTCFAREILIEVRKAVGPDFPIIFRLDASEILDGGIDPQESADIAERLMNTGVDAFDLSVGTHYRLNRSMCSELEPMSYVQGWRLDLVEKIKKHLRVPVIAAGPFREPNIAENAIKEGKVDFVALGRPFIADPQWAVKALKGRNAEIRRCISCNEGCVRARVFEDRPISCTVNPEVSLEYRNFIDSAVKTRRLMVVGGGPAGCVAAIYARQRGHDVVLIERGSELGGNCLLGSRLPRKEKLAWVVEHHHQWIDQLGVEVRLETPFSRKLLQEINPHVLVLSIGAVPFIPQDIEIGDIVPLHAEELIRKGHSWSKEQVAVIGGGALGCELALALAKADNKVVVLEACEDAARDIEPISRWDLLDRLSKESRVHLLINARVQLVDSNKILYETAPGTHTNLSVDQIVWATGYRPRDLEEELPFDLFPELEVKRIGDCLKPRNVFHAIRDGFWLGVTV